MGKFTDNLTAGNGGRSKAVPVGSRRYEMGGISFYLNQTPREVLGGWVHLVIDQLQKNGQLEAAKEMLQNPQPFMGHQPAMAVFMASTLEIEKLGRKLGLLESAIAKVAEVVAETDDVSKARVQSVLSAMKEDLAKVDDEGESLLTP